MQSFHTLPLINIVPESAPHKSPIVSILRVTFRKDGIHNPSIGCGTLVRVLVLHSTIEQLKFVGVIKFFRNRPRQSVTLKLEREEVGHGAHFGGDCTVETVTVEGDVLEETQLRNFRGEFSDKVVTHCKRKTQLEY